jgi:hypothetical protein
MRDKPDSLPRPAPPDGSPYGLLVSGLQTRLRAEAANAYAGTARASDGGVDVYLTSVDASVSRVVEQVRAATGGQVPIHMVTGMRNTLATLEGVRSQILARRNELLARGIKIVEFGVHVTANRVRVGVKGLTADAAASLIAEFGADRILVFEGGEYIPVST